MDSQIKVTISCLSFNHSKYIRNTLDGFLMQKTNFKYEVIIHDDASTDGTQDIIKEYQEKYPDIIKPILQTENHYSKGIKISKTFIYPIAKGEYIAYCEGDDYWTDENKLQMQVDFLDSHPEYSACCHNTKRYNAKKKRYDGYVSNRKKDCDLNLEDVVMGGGVYQTSSLVLRKEYLFKGYTFKDMIKGIGDYPLAIALTIHSKIRYFSKVASVYRLFSTPNSFTRQATREKMAYLYLQVLEMLEVVKTYATKEQLPCIERAIEHNEYNVLDNSNKKEKFKVSPYKEFYQRASKKSKIKLWLKRNFSVLYKIYEKVKNG